MNKKQGIIIITLLALIICVGVLSRTVNGPLVGFDENAEDKTAISVNNNEELNKSSNYFTESRIIRENQTAVALQDLKAIIDDENIDKEQKSETIEQFTIMSTNLEKETNMELALKGKGYDDALCMIENNNKVRVFVKSDKALTTKQVKEIHDVVMSITSFSDVEIETKQ